jgi:hypothetical protein
MGAMPMHATLCKMSTHVAASIQEEGLVLLHTQTGQIFTANAAGAHIWDGLERQWPLDRISDDMSRCFGITPSTATNDTAVFVARLAAFQLIERSAA